MKALVYHGTQDVRYESVPDATLPNERGAVVRVTAAGICGSDLHIYGGHGFRPGGGYSVGHEAIGVVAELGSAVEGFAVGDRVLLTASVGCGRCPACATGNVLACANPAELGVYGIGAPHLCGCQAEAVAVPNAEMNLRHLPPEIDDDTGLVLTDNAPTGWLGARLGGVTPGDTVAVVGLGPVGAMAVQAALLMGASRVFAIDLVEGRRRRAESLGAEPIDGDPKAAIAELTAGRGVDVAVEAVGADETIRLAIDLVGVEGRVGVVGVNQNQRFPFPMVVAQLKGIQFRIGLASVQLELQTLLPLVQAGRIDASAVVTHHLPLSEGADAYALFASRRDDVGKVVLEVG